MRAKKINNAKVIRPFTLLEIVISLGLLTLIASVCGWGIHGLVAEYQYRKGYTLLLSDLKKSHLIALANQTDLELRFWKEGTKVIYQFRTDDPIACFVHKPLSLPGIEKINREKKEVQALSIPLYSTGRIGESPTQISFFKKNGEGFILYLETPHMYKIELRSPHAHYKPQIQTRAADPENPYL